ncbi:MAG: cadmium-translocating P-type ATPase [Paludibacteraceae bacterium]|nr:cadmium-translocating P-type ATPase [Paludibacteraceae bacterium]
METENKIKIGKIIASSVLLVVAVLIEHSFNLPMWQLLLVYLVPYLIAGYDVLIEAAEDLSHGEALDEDFLMSLATVGALAIGFMPGAENQFPEAVFVMLFFQVGELFEEIAEGRSRKSISKLMDIRPDVANVERDGVLSAIAPDSVQIGETIIIKPGEKVPLDGFILEGDSSLDTVALTGESVPRTIHAGDDIMSGCVNLSGVVKVRVTKSFGESTASKVLELVENASENKSKSENFISKFARIYTPIVVALALIVAFVPPLLSESFIANFGTWLYRALTFLVVSCPCALVISVPLTFFGGIGGASKRGILVKGSNYMETLAKVSTIAFDKTGTMTEGVFSVTAIHPDKINDIELLHYAAHVERYSTHPIAISLKQVFVNEDDNCKVENVQEVAGKGISANINGHQVYVGNEKLMDELKVQSRPCHKFGTVVHLAMDGEYAGHIIVSDKVKSDAAEAVSALKSAGVSRLVMLTGDKKEVAADVAKIVGIEEYEAELLPDGKVNVVEQLLREPHDGKVAFVGDGINDAPVLARADVGIAMGGLGSDAAIEAADVVLMDDKPSKIAEAIRLARRTLNIAKQNTAFAIIIKVAVLVLAFFGLATMWMAVFADVGVTFLAVLNAMRTLRVNNIAS